MSNGNGTARFFKSYNIEGASERVYKYHTQFHDIKSDKHP
jgi:hypothetical protein